MIAPFKSYTLFALTYTEYLRLLLKCRTTEETCLISLAVEYGLRREDVVSLELRNINLMAKKFSWNEKKKGGRIMTRPLTDQVILDLTRHINTLKNGERFLFPSRRKHSKSGHLSGYHAWCILQDLCLHADIDPPQGRKDRPFHSLRGTCYKLKRNRDKWTVEQAAAWLGDSMGTAMKHYGTVSESELFDLVTSG